MKPKDVEALAEVMGGLPILGSIPGSPAHRAGLRYGDVVLSVNGLATPTLEEYVEAIARRDDLMEVVLFRAGETLTLRVQLERRRELDVAAALRRLIYVN